MPNGNSCKISLSFPLHDAPKLHVESYQFHRGDRAAVDRMVRYLREVADVIEAQDAHTGKVIDEAGRPIATFEYRS